jgi:ATP-dependent Clp protease ATP-binding subunit ClpA
MLSRLKQRMRDMQTIKTLCLAAEQHALRGGEQEPGAEHFLLAALELPEGSARRTFERVNANPDEVRDAITRQYQEALRHIGIEPERLTAMGAEAPLSARNNSLYRAKSSGQELMLALARLRKQDKDAPLLGAHVVAVVASMKQGVAARSLRAMRVDLMELHAAAIDEIRSFTIPA